MTDTKAKKRYSYGLDLLRLLSTVAVLVYHLDPDGIPGGYLAVCSFLVLHGYLFVLSFLKNEKPSLIRHYLKRLRRLYLPMAVTVAVTVLSLRLAPDVVWINEKPETMSVLTAWNNWWQISAGQSYFARLTDSPFTHMWYLSLLLQEELVLPFVCLIYSKLRDRFGFAPVWIPFVIQTAAAAAILPRFVSMGYPDMRIYYGTDARMFSTLFGMALAFLHREKPRSCPSFMKKGPLSVLLFAAGTGALAYLCFTVSPEHPLFPIGFLLSSLLTLPVISVSTYDEAPLSRVLSSPAIRYLSSFTYEVYLVHYPLLFFAAHYREVKGLILVLYLLTVFAFSFLLHFSMDIRFSFDRKHLAPNLARILLLIPLLYAVLLGCMDIHAAQDHTQEMLELEKQLEENARLLEEHQKEYAEKQEAEAAYLSDPLSFSAEVDAAHMHITGIGDSVMLGALRTLYDTFPNGDFDAQQNRSHYPVMKIVKERNRDGSLGNPIVIGIGTNNTLPIDDLRAIVYDCGERDIFWITTTNDWQFKNNDTIRQLGEEFPNVTVIDWEAISKPHGEYFYSDGIHLTEDGRRAYTDIILHAIEERYGSFLSEQLRQEQLEKRILGIGGSWLMASASGIQESLDDCVVLASEKPDTDLCVKEIQTMRERGLLPQKVFIAVGNSEEDIRLFDAVLPVLDGCDILLVTLSGSPASDEVYGIDQLSWDISYNQHPEYFLADRIHLSAQGVSALSSFLLQAVRTKWAS